MLEGRGGLCPSFSRSDISLLCGTSCVHGGLEDVNMKHSTSARLPRYFFPDSGKGFGHISSQAKYRSTMAWVRPKSYNFGSIFAKNNLLLLLLASLVEWTYMCIPVDT